MGAYGWAVQTQTWGPFLLTLRNGSVLVQAQAVFQGEAPSSSHIIRTLVAGASWGHDAFSWWLEPHSISSNGKQSSCHSVSSLCIDRTPNPRGGGLRLPRN